jgi:uncharacterized protein with gpF-like domain
MLNIFEKFAPRWRNAVARYAKAAWTGNLSVYADWTYNKQAVHFASEYRHAMELHYADKGMRVYRGTLDGYVNEWLKKQQALKDTLKIVATEKQDNLVKKALEELKDTKDAQKVIDKIYGAKLNEEVYKVFSFKDNFEAFSKQHGDDAAFELGTGMNEGIIKQFSDRYFWKTQKDKKVRPTHEMLQGKCFMFSDPPTTIDKYGNRHTGNPGTDYGCRCWAERAPEKEKPLRGFVVKESQRHKK